MLARAAGLRGGAARRRRRPAAAVGRRLRDVRRRALARERGDGRPVEIELRPPQEQPDALRTRIVPQLDDLEQMRLALELGLHDYVTQERLRRRRDRPLGRHRLGADGGALRRGARRRARARRLDAVALLVGGDARRRASGSPRRSGSTSARSRSSRSSRRSPARSRRTSPGARATSPRRTCRRASAARC